MVGYPWLGLVMEIVYLMSGCGGGGQWWGQVIVPGVWGTPSPGQVQIVLVVA